MKQKISKLILAFIMGAGILFSGNASNISAATDATNAPSDWAFEESSIPLHDAILANYPTIDTNGDGYISISEAQAVTGAIALSGKSITGTLNGIENFTSINQLNLSNNQLTGEIPSNIGNITNLNDLRLWTNKLTGSIPTSIGNLSNLTYLSIQNNQLTGSMPASLGNLNNLQHLYLAINKLSGPIPATINNITTLRGLNLSENELSGSIPNLLSLTAILQINVGDNKLSGDIPNEIYALPMLSDFRVNGNKDLVGNPATGFATSTTLNYLDIRGSMLIQASPEIPTLGYHVGTFLYDNLATELLIDNKTSLADGVTQDTINKAQESADFITDTIIKQQWQDDIDLAQQMLNAKDKVDMLLVAPGLNDLKPGITINDIDDAQNLVTALPNGTLKDELQAKIDTARDLLDAKDKVDGLLTKPDLANLQDGVNKGIVDEAQNAVNKLPSGDLKDELQKKIDTANNLLDAKKKTEELLNPDGSIVAGVDQGKINEAQEAVNKLPNGATKTKLQKMIDDAQKQLNQKSEINKASISGGDMASGSAVSTGDSTNLTILYAMLGASFLGLTISMKRGKGQEK